VLFRSGGAVVAMSYDIEIEEEKVAVSGPDFDLEVKGSIPDRWAIIVIALIAGFLGIKEFAI